MNKRKGGLGKGLGALLEEYKDEDSSIREVQIQLIHKSPYQPRVSIEPESIQELAKSIQENGLIEPLVVRFVDTYYELIAGHRRLEALRSLQYTKAPVYILEISDRQAAQLTIVENIQREDLNPLDLANSLQVLIQTFSMTHEECASSIGKSRVYVTNSLRLLQLDENTKNALQKGYIQEGHARLLLSVKEPDERERILAYLITQKLSVKELSGYIAKTCGKKKPKVVTYPHYKPQEKYLTDFLHKPVQVFHNQIRIKFKDEKELREIFEQLQLSYYND
ncbi:MAG: ParB/RepB/Spo0J family partition protein [Caldisericia bacterium]|nr:ParB/RepB/Spo0J family partition protein [Caldisericia bacterium]